MTHLRLRARLSQDQAAKAAGTSQPTWGRYESGDSRAFYERLTVRSRILAALGFTARDLEAEVRLLEHDERFPSALDRADAPETGMFETDPAVKTLMDRLGGPHIRFMRQLTEDMAPYLQAGEVVFYDLKALPRRYGGVVVKLKSGGYLVRRFIRQGSHFVELLHYEASDTEGRPAYEEVIGKLPLTEVDGLYPIVAAGSHFE
nr:helix-turn-helix domain-containing protein [Asticcacaulis aquaticus]